MKRVGWEPTTKTWLSSDQSALFQLPGAALFWGEHSYRNWLPSVAATLGYSKTQRDYLGRWAAEESNEYVRTSQQIIQTLQQEIADKLRGNPFIVDEVIIHG